MTQIIITLDKADIVALEKIGDKHTIAKVFFLHNPFLLPLLSHMCFCNGRPLNKLFSVLTFSGNSGIKGECDQSNRRGEKADRNISLHVICTNH
jgi:hypothetical protein